MSANGWSLEVVRGRDVGRRYPLSGPDVVLGSAPGGLDLSGQESGPRRMAARQARVALGASGPSIADLDSPGGTFVNRQRVLPGVARALQAGDVIQLGGVQLKVVGGSTPAPPSPPAPGPTPQQGRPPSGVATVHYRLPSGTVCRNADEFLVVAGQRWAELREELTSGRLAAGLAGTLLAPEPDAGSPDERLDAWLGALPASRPARPELEVHPTRLALRAGGGTTRRTIRVGNIGFRLLRSTVRVEPPGVGWLRVAPSQAGRAIVTVESTEVGVEIDLPESLDAPRSAALVVESNGGTGRVEVVVEPALGSGDPGPSGSAGSPGWSAGEWLAGRSLAARMAAFVGALVALRLLVWAGGWLGPGLAGPAELLGLVGALAGLAFGFRRGEPADRPACGFAGAVAGVVAASVAVAASRSVEGFAPGLPGALVVWAALGAGLAALSAKLVPIRGGDPT
jgi:hypothetical protein